MSLLDAVAILAAGLAAGVVNAVAGTGTLLEHRRRADWSAGRPAPASERAPGVIVVGGLAAVVKLLLS